MRISQNKAPLYMVCEGKPKGQPPFGVPFFSHTLLIFPEGSLEQSVICRVTRA